MKTDPDRVLTELALPLAPGAGLLDALGVAVALEQAYGVTLPDSALSLDHLRDRESIELVLDSLAKRA